MGYLFPVAWAWWLYGGAEGQGLTALSVHAGGYCMELLVSRPEQERGIRISYVPKIHVTYL